MTELICYKKLPIWNKETLPSAFMKKHNTLSGTWAKLHIIAGSLDFALLNENDDITKFDSFNKEQQPLLIEPQQWHKIVTVSPDFKGQLSFYCKAEDYVAKKYNMTQTHSEVLNASKIIKPCKVLDLGCGAGRNSLYLNLLNFQVTALDRSEKDIIKLQEIIKKESLQNFQAENYDINQATIDENYDFIVSTVVMMFLNPQRIPSIIQNIQEHTNIGGYNLIVSAMSTNDYPCNMPFSFTFKENELKDYYQNWQILKYNEDLGTLHKVDSDGNRIQLRFATLLAKKQ